MLTTLMFIEQSKYHTHLKLGVNDGKRKLAISSTPFLFI